jgi:hypothetical protein
VARFKKEKKLDISEVYSGVNVASAAAKLGFEIHRADNFLSLIYEEISREYPPIEFASNAYKLAEARKKLRKPYEQR